MKRALKLARTMGRTPSWYKRATVSPEAVAWIVDTIDYPLVQSGLITRKKIQDIMNVYLRFWSGCMSMAKVIALETRSGVNTPEYRGKTSKKIMRIAKKDKAYRDGVCAAMMFKIYRNQEYSVTGIDKTIIKQLGWTPKK